MRINDASSHECSVAGSSTGVLSDGLKAIAAMEYRSHNLIERRRAVDDRGARAAVPRFVILVPLQNSIKVCGVLAKRVARSRREPAPDRFVVHHETAHPVEQVPHVGFVVDRAKEKRHSGALGSQPSDELGAVCQAWVTSQSAGVGHGGSTTGSPVTL